MCGGSGCGGGYSYSSCGGSSCGSSYRTFGICGGSSCGSGFSSSSICGGGSRSFGICGSYSSSDDTVYVKHINRIQNNRPTHQVSIEERVVAYVNSLYESGKISEEKRLELLGLSEKS